MDRKEKIEQRASGIRTGKRAFLFGFSWKFLNTKKKNIANIGETTQYALARLTTKLFKLYHRSAHRSILGTLLVLFLINQCCMVHASPCQGKFVNPITDICWSCIFPITIAGIKITRGLDTPNPKTPICMCSDPFPRIGIPVSFWEPARLVDVTRTPFCLVSLGGIQLGSTGIKRRGAVDVGADDGMRQSFYQVHYYMYPVIYWLELITDLICLEKSQFDVMYLTEFDPFWNDDEVGFILNPEAVLFANPIAQAACAVDCGMASTNFGSDLLFWCGGCQGGLYPFTGTVASHVGGVQASLLIVQKMLAKLHRQGLAWGYVGKKGLCGKYPMPIIQKTQYKTQMTYPRAATRKGCYPLGKTSVIWGAGREFPYKGEDFGYLIWRKRSCCLF